MRDAADRKPSRTRLTTLARNIGFRRKREMQYLGPWFTTSNVTGTVTLAGLLGLSIFSGYAAGQTFTIINSDGADAVVGTYAGLPQGANIQIGGGSTLTISYVGGDGNDVTLTADAVDVFAVTNTPNSGSGSLRQAILNANASPGPDGIAFNIAGVGPHTIQPTSSLPFITGQTFIDGFTEPDTFNNVVPVIVINGALAGNVDGLALDSGSDGSLINGLVINGFTQDGIQVINSNNQTITANYIGTDVTGALDLGNRFDGVRIDGDSNPSSAARNNTIGVAGGLVNVISGNGDGGGSPSGGQGVNILGTNSVNNVIQNNYNGVASDGLTALRSTDQGIQILLGNNNNQVGGTVAGTRNVIVGATNQHGIIIGSDNNTIQGNYVGVGIDGFTSIGSGIGIDIDSDGVVNARNIIAGNTDGIIIQNNPSTATIRGNYIGLGANGTTVIGNSSDGIEIRAANQISGGVSAGAANVIVGNQVGINAQVWGGHTVFGNFIGTNEALTLSGGNNRGIVSNNQNFFVGGVNPGEGNVITNSTQQGIATTGASVPVIRGNRIFNNGGLGIDLGTNGVTTSNLPVITSVSTTGGLTTAIGTITAAVSQTYRIEFFSSPTADPSGYGEGQNYIGFQDVTTDGLGAGTFNALLLPVSAGNVVSAVAVQPSGTRSEFALSQSATGATIVSSTADSGPGSLRQAILDANLTPGAATIEFGFFAAGPHVINLLSALPTISDPLTIDGYSQSGASANTLLVGNDAVLNVVLEGSFLDGSGEFGLSIEASNSVVRGVVRLSSSANNTSANTRPG